MGKQAAAAGTLLLLFGLVSATLAVTLAPRTIGPIYDSPDLDYQPSIIRLAPGGALMVVFERFGNPSLGDFYVTTSNDHGETWTVPQEILESPLYERHPSLLQLGPNSFVLFYLVDTTGGGNYRLHRATSSDGANWTDQGQLDLGWTTAGEINPNVIREADGTLTMTYQRLYGASYIARSSDGGATWDKLKTQVSEGNAQLPRLAKRESDGLYLVTYQVGSSNLDLFAKVSANPYDWSSPQIPISTQYNTHDSQPIVLEDGTFLVTYAKTPIYYFDLFYRTSCDGVVWSDEVQVTNDPAHYDTQPHPIVQGTPGHLILVWPHQEGSTPYVDHDVWVNTDVAVPPDLAASSKSAEPAFARAGNPLTYTLRLRNEGYGPTGAWLGDPIPQDTVYQPGSLWASSGQASFDPAKTTIHWSGTISTCAQITIGFRVNTSAGLADGQVVGNTAWLSDSQGLAATLAATTTVDALPPISAILAPGSGQLISVTTPLVAGVATDTVSGVGQVSVSVDGGPWQAASGQETWTWQSPPLGEGQHNLRSQASDVAGQVESAGQGITFTLDATFPGLVSVSPVSGAVNIAVDTPVTIRFDEELHDWHLEIWPEVEITLIEGNVPTTRITYYHRDFAGGQVYTCTISARDRALNRSEAISWSFRTRLFRRYLPVALRNGP